MSGLRAACVLGIAGVLGGCGGGGDGECIDLDPTPDFDFLVHRGLDVADMNGDGLADLVYSTRLVLGSDPAAQVCGGIAPADGSVTVRLQDPAAPGTFLPAARYDTRSDSPGYLKLADVNADTRPDVILTSRYRTASFELLLHDPANPGRLRVPLSYPTVADPHQVAVGDIDEDGRVDIAVSGRTRLVWHPQQPDGGFGVQRDVGSGRDSVALADFDGDGKLDLASLDGTPDHSFSEVPEHPGDVLVFRQGGGLASGFALAARIRMSASLWMLAAGDVDADGAADLVAAGFDAEDLDFYDVWYRVIRSAADPLTFTKSEQVRAWTSLAAAPVVVDLNGDGRNDVILGGDKPRNRSRVTVYLQGEPPGTFPDKTVYTLPIGYPVEYGAIESVVVADLNGDTLPDIAVSNLEVHVLFQLAGAAGRFGEPVKVSDWRP
ncbi:MAG: FG-GAP repeat domain-containing protein [Planctomycetota bacterium]